MREISDTRSPAAFTTGNLPFLEVVRIALASLSVTGSETVTRSVVMSVAILVDLCGGDARLAGRRRGEASMLDDMVAASSS